MNISDLQFARRTLLHIEAEVKAFERSAADRHDDVSHARLRALRREAFAVRSLIEHQIKIQQGTPFDTDNGNGKSH